jgi:hypothetical protein
VHGNCWPWLAPSRPGWDRVISWTTREGFENGWQKVGRLVLNLRGRMTTPGSQSRLLAWISRRSISVLIQKSEVEMS